jgi:uncharacterized protein YlxP (DUF503 family)
VELYLPGSSSLKDKRKVLRSLKDRIARRFNLSIAEIDHQELWQRSLVGMVMVSSDRAVVERSLQGAQAEIERIVPGEILEISVDYLE